MTFKRSESHDLYQPVEYKNLANPGSSGFQNEKKPGKHLLWKQMFYPGCKNVLTWFCFVVFIK